MSEFDPDPAIMDGLDKVEGSVTIDSDSGRVIDDDDLPGGDAEPKKSAGDATAKLMFTASVIIARMKQKPSYALTMEEAFELGGAVDDVAEKYDWNLDLGPELNLLLVVGGIVGARMEVTAPPEPEKEEGAEDGKAEE